MRSLFVRVRSYHISHLHFFVVIILERDQHQGFLGHFFFFFFSSWHMERERRVLFIRVLLCRHHSFPSWCKIFLIFLGGYVFLFSSCRSFLTFGNWSSAVDNGSYFELILLLLVVFGDDFLSTVTMERWDWRSVPGSLAFCFFFLSPRDFVACV